MAGPAVLQVRVVAVHVTCGLCGDHQRIPRHGDAFEQQREPFTAWWTAHLAPRVTCVEVTANGVTRMWDAA